MPKKNNNGFKRDVGKSASNADFAIKVVNALLTVAKTVEYAPAEQFRDRGFSGEVCRALKMARTERSWKLVQNTLHINALSGVMTKLFERPENERILPEGITLQELKASLDGREDDKVQQLPHCALSRHNENFIKRHFDKKTDGLEVSIRVVYNSDENFEVMQNMKALFTGFGGKNGQFCFQNKMLMAFQKVASKTICFFAMCVQEYGNKCAAPNTNCVYISFLDSVKLFKPAEHRTAMYRQIILGYMSYAQSVGYETAHIWSSALPSDAIGYLFFSRPKDQGIIDQNGLNDWYEEMLDDAHPDPKEADPKDLPYFKGDFWPDFLEREIAKVKAGDKNAKRKELLHI